jgi:hypothetical protein
MSSVVSIYEKKLGIIIDIKTKVINGNWEAKPFSSQEEQLKDLMATKMCQMVS